MNTSCTLSNFPDYVELIVYFGQFGNGLDRVVRQFGLAGNLEVQCGSGISGTELSWFRENQTEVLQKVFVETPITLIPE